ncbi:MAG: AAA family ATPase [Tissierellales bacterium]|nr:AAA family ATPase [Tissierellales bacterium]
MIFGDNIKKFRTEINLTQQELADISGVNISIIKHIETGNRGTAIDNLKKIADALNVPLAEIYVDDYRPTEIYTVLNSKGGCSKTSIVSNVGYELSKMGKRVLLVDADLQCNLTYSLGQDFEMSRSIYKALIDVDHDVNPSNIEDFIRSTGYENLDVVISDFEMATIEMDLTLKSYRESLMETLIRPLIDKGVYDYIIFDCNPMLGLLNQNILSVSDNIIVPVELSPFGVMGLDVLIRFIKKAQRVNKNLQISGLIKTKVDNRYNMTSKVNETLELLTSKVDINIYKSFIPTDAKIPEAQWERMPLNVYIEGKNKKSKADKQFKAFAKEIMSNSRG